MIVTHSILISGKLYIAQDFPLLFIIIFLRTSHFLPSLSSSSQTQQQLTAQYTAQQGTCGSGLSRMTGALYNIPPTETQLQRKHYIVHLNTANAATENMTHETQLNTVPKNGSHRSVMLNAIGY
jgi:hypothetical protein